jgi:hypothetical protein
MSEGRTWRGGRLGGIIVVLGGIKVVLRLEGSFGFAGGEIGGGEVRP